MDDYSVKIYIANESDTLDAISEKFNIDKQLLIIFNPLLKNKYKLTNLPIKIPYKKEMPSEETKEKRNDSINGLIMKVVKPFKNYIIYKDLRNFENNYQKEKVFSELDSLGDKDKEIYSIIFSSIFEIIDKYEEYTKEEFEEAIDKINKNYQKINKEEIKDFYVILLTYNNKIKEGKFEEAEKYFDNYEKSLKKQPRD